MEQEHNQQVSDYDLEMLLKRSRIILMLLETGRITGRQYLAMRDSTWSMDAVTEEQETRHALELQEEGVGTDFNYTDSPLGHLYYLAFILRPYQND